MHSALWDEQGDINNRRLGFEPPLFVSEHNRPLRWSLKPPKKQWRHRHIWRLARIKKAVSKWIPSRPACTNTFLPWLLGGRPRPYTHPKHPKKKYSKKETEWERAPRFTIETRLWTFVSALDFLSCRVFGVFVPGPSHGGAVPHNRSNLGHPQPRRHRRHHAEGSHQHGRHFSTNRNHSRSQSSTPHLTCARPANKHHQLRQTKKHAQYA